MAFKDCSNPSRPIFYAIDDEKGKIHVIYPRCKLWSCPECRDLLAWVWAQRLKRGIELYREQGLQEWQMLTITSHEKLHGMTACLSVWPSAWGKLSTRLRRETRPLKYALMPELHKDTRVHVHLLTNSSVSTRWLKNNARQCGLGYQVDAEEIEDAGRAIFYAIKYLGKSAGEVKWPRGFRRVRTSQQWPQMPETGVVLYNFLEWHKWRQNGEKAYFAALSTLAWSFRDYQFICDDLRSTTLTDKLDKPT